MTDIRSLERTLLDNFETEKRERDLVKFSKINAASISCAIDRRSPTFGSRLVVGVLNDEGFQDRRDLLLLRAWEL